ncbi:Cu/Ag efflux protein CusF [Rhodoblastus sphagnicola]|nr:copper-binding protein [Rhodoblastus sphagnicola]MBB4199822.1 Cu/Ag efflux protein CusF [Rhodoblastus sphagnicola]
MKKHASRLILVSILVIMAAAWAPTVSIAEPVRIAQIQAAKVFHGVGKVTGVDAQAGLVTIDHEAIAGLMDAMEMQYEAKPAKMLEGLQKGDSVSFDVDGKTLALLGIRKK